MWRQRLLSQFKYSARESSILPSNGLTFSCVFVCQRKSTGVARMSWRKPDDTGRSRPATFGEYLLFWREMRNKNHQLKGLNPGYKNGGGKTHFLKLRTNRTPQQHETSSWRPSAGREEQKSNGFWDLSPQAQGETEFSLIYVKCDFLVLNCGFEARFHRGGRTITLWSSAVGPKVHKFTALLPRCCIQNTGGSFLRAVVKTYKST